MPMKAEMMTESAVLTRTLPILCMKIARTFLETSRLVAASARCLFFRIAEYSLRETISVTTH